MEKPQSVNRRTLLTGAVAAGLYPLVGHAGVGPFELKGQMVQGGYAFGRSGERKAIVLDGVVRGLTSESGHFVIGFDRDAPKQALLTIDGHGSQQIEVAPGTFDIQRIDGLPPSLVTPTDPALLERIGRERILKDKGFSSREDEDWFKGGFRWPLKDFRVSGTFGNQRILNGETKSPHYGIDLAAPTGTEVRAPQTARVVLAEPNLHFEGGLILLDHGQGLISMYLHLSAIEVKTGDIVRRGEVIGLVGATGRATGPHLCWRLKWRDRALDPSLMVKS